QTPRVAFSPFDPSDHDTSILHALTVYGAPFARAFHKQDGLQGVTSSNRADGFVARIVLKALGLRTPIFDTLRKYCVPREEWWREWASHANGHTKTNFMLSDKAAL